MSKKRKKRKKKELEELKHEQTTPEEVAKEEITYESVCAKLGFDLESYQPEISDYEDDSKVSPFSLLSDDELDFVIEYQKNLLRKQGLL